MPKPLLLRVHSVHDRRQRQNGQLRVQSLSDENSVSDSHQAVWWTIADPPLPRMKRETIGQGQVNSTPYASLQVPSLEGAKRTQGSRAAVGGASDERSCCPAPVNAVIPAGHLQRSGVKTENDHEHGHSRGEPPDVNYAGAGYTLGEEATVGGSRRLDSSRATSIERTPAAKGETTPQRRRNDCNGRQSLSPTDLEHSMSQRHQNVRSSQSAVPIAPDVRMFVCPGCNGGDCVTTTPGFGANYGWKESPGVGQLGARGGIQGECIATR